MLLEYAMLLAVSNADFSSNIAHELSLDDQLIYARLLVLLREILPSGWQPQLIAQKEGAKSDAILKITAPSGSSATLCVELKKRFEPRDVVMLRNAAAHLNDGPLLLVTPFLSLRSQELLRQQNISYIDFNRNIWLATNSLLIDRQGSNNPPSSDDERPARSSLRGPKTARIVRYLCDFYEPLKVRNIAAATSVNAGNVSRILELLSRESLVTRDHGSVSSTDWEALIKRWAVDFAKDRYGQAFLEPHGLSVFNNRLRHSTRQYAVTGAFASAQLAPAAMPVAADIYVTNIEAFANDLELRRSERVGNVRLIEAPDRVVFERLMHVNGFSIAAPSQVAADLLTLPKRSNDEYDSLLVWMRENELSWRR
jgi:hypothetical protein